MLPPGDKVPSTDYLLAQNWRSDRFGKLASRYGYRQKFSIAGAGIAHSAEVFGGVNGYYYVGANDSITTPTGSVYFNLGASAIATGFDGNRIAFAVMNGFMWMMNRGKQGRHNATVGFETWNLDPPTASIAAASAATPSPSSSVTFTYTTQSNPDYIHYLTVSGVSYSYAEGTNTNQALVIAMLAANDPNVTVTYTGSGNDVVITPIAENVIIRVSGSDSNASTNIATGSVTDLPNGTYRFYVTFAASDDSLESNAGPVSAAVALASQAVALTGVPVSGDSRVGKRNIYAIGGTLNQPYLVGTIPDNSTTSITISTSDLQATNGGVVMPIFNDPPPAASGMIGPFFSRLVAWSTAAHPNRVFYTDIDKPQYWPGSNDEDEGNWVDVGAEGEAVVWCTIHANTMFFYKEKSVWALIGDFETGSLERIDADTGLAGQFAVVSSHTVDYFVTSGTLALFTMDSKRNIGEQILPLFTEENINNGHLTQPGTILPGTNYNSTSIYPYALALGYGMGKLYVGYAEWAASSPQYCLLVYHEDSGRWFYHRNAISGVTGFFGFVYDGSEMVGLTGAHSGAAIGENLDDFGIYANSDPGTTAIDCVYQSHFEDCGLPDNQKNWLEVVIDAEYDHETGTVYVSLDNGTKALTLVGTVGNASAAGRTSKGFPLALNGSTGAIEARNATSTTQLDALARNISVAVVWSTTHGVKLHNVYLYYYAEARLAMSASSLPTDLGIGKIKQVKEVELDIDASGGTVNVQILSDYPSQVLAIASSATVSNSGRASMKLQLSATGFILRLQVNAESGPFRLYGARVLARQIGTFVEAYESAAGFLWDSGPLSFDSGVTHIPRAAGIALAALPVKRAREISLEIATSGNVTVALYSDLPGNSLTSRFSTTVNTASAGRSFVRIPLPAGTNAEIEGRLFRLQLSGSSQYALCAAAVEILPIGVYIEAYEATGGAVWDSRELDFGSAKPKECREIELDIETDAASAVTVSLYSDMSPTAGTYNAQTLAFSTSIVSSGRQSIRIPTTTSAVLEQFAIGRQFRVILSGTNAFRLYGARLKVREYGEFLVKDQSDGGALWDSTPLDLGSQRVKMVKRVEIDIATYNTVTAKVFDGSTPTVGTTFTIASSSGVRNKVTYNMPPGLTGQFIQVQISGGACALYAVRVWQRPLNDPSAAWQWADMPVAPTVPDWKWQDLPVNPTEAQWFWADVLSVEETPNVWTLVDVDMQVTG